MLRAAILLVGYALYLFFLNKAIAGVVIGFTTFGVLFYFLTIPPLPPTMTAHS